MDPILNLFGIEGLAVKEKTWLIYSCFCLLICWLLFYFWFISRSKIKSNNKDGYGLVYMAFAFLLYFVIGIVSVYDTATRSIPPPETSPFVDAYLILSGLISLCFLWSLPFFSVGTHKVDTWVEHNYWKEGIKYFGFGWVITVALGDNEPFLSVVSYMDVFIAVLSLSLLGYFITRYFMHRGLRFLALFCGCYFLAIVALQLYFSGDTNGKFDNMTMVFLGPALTLSIIVMAYTFNWINELNFYELSNIWINTSGTEEGPQQFYSQLTVKANQSTWLEKIAEDQIETVIEEMIILKKHKNESLETIITIASRNTRNNNDQLKGTISREAYQLTRNQISDALLQLV